MGVTWTEASERFWSFVDRSQGERACWNWTGPVRARDGYGVLSIPTRQESAHRAAFILTHGGIPVGYVVTRMCGNRQCCNPKHLEAVPLAEFNRARVRADIVNKCACQTGG